MESSVMEQDVVTVENDTRGLIAEGLAEVKKKISGKDMARIAVKVGRDVYTIRKYLNGDVRDVELGNLILLYANGFIAINNNTDFQKEQLKY